MVIHSLDSLAILAHDGAFANTPSPRVKLTGTQADASEIRYMLEVPNEPDESWPTSPRILGAFLARDLGERGLIATEEADEMREALIREPASEEC
ncbi:MAG TPA: hypothetical protein VF590_17800 [Isosphaeraceae bacterium]|jgi:hypothetical protein